MKSIKMNYEAALHVRDAINRNLAGPGLVALEIAATPLAGDSGLLSKREIMVNAQYDELDQDCRPGLEDPTRLIETLAALLCQVLEEYDQSQVHGLKADLARVIRVTLGYV